MLCVAPNHAIKRFLLFTLFTSLVHSLTIFSMVSYMKMKEKACEKVGFTTSTFEYPETISEAELMQIVANRSRDASVDGKCLPLLNIPNSHALNVRHDCSASFAKAHRFI